MITINKRLLLLFLTVIFIMCTVCGCRTTKGGKEVVGEKTEDGYLYTKNFGSYTIPEGWKESDLSAKEKYVYVKEGTGEQDVFNNFVVGSGENDYSEEEHELFKQAIVQQLSNSLSELDGVTLEATGSTTNQGYTLYTFKITEENGTVTTQYYIVGEKKYCLIQETNYDKSKECDDAAKQAVNRFVWSNK